MYENEQNERKILQWRLLLGLCRYNSVDKFLIMTGLISTIAFPLKTIKFEQTKAPYRHHFTCCGIVPQSRHKVIYMFLELMPSVCHGKALWLVDRCGCSLHNELFPKKNSAFYKLYTWVSPRGCQGKQGWLLTYTYIL